MLKEMQTPLLNSEIVKVTKNVIDYEFRKWSLFLRYPSGI